jgi:hypothetical protein
MVTGNKWKIGNGKVMQKALEITNTYMILFRQHNRRRQLKCLEYKTINMSSQRVDFEVQINQPRRTTISQDYYLTFIYSSTCFGRPHSHHQELNNCSSSLWFYCWSVVTVVLLVVVGPVITGLTTTNSTAITKLQQ